MKYYISLISELEHLQNIPRIAQKEVQRRNLKSPWFKRQHLILYIIIPSIAARLTTNNSEACASSHYIGNSYSKGSTNGPKTKNDSSYLYHLGRL